MLTAAQELPRRKQVVTQDRSKVLRETENNPFEDDEDESPGSVPGTVSSTAPLRHASHASSQAQTSKSANPPAISFFSPTKAKKEREKEKKRNKKGKPFNLEAEKDTMKNCIAEASVASTSLLNALRLINREHEQISENKAAAHHFEFCKLLRRKILRYVRL